MIFMGFTGKEKPRAVSLPGVLGQIEPSNVLCGYF